MTVYTTKLTEKKPVAENTVAFHFVKPAGFEYRAGQFITLTLIDPPKMDARGPKRMFSLSSAPYEPDLYITSRIRDTAFKTILNSMAIGAEIKVGGPYGNFMLHADTEKPAVFLAGGIGITPFYSIIKQASHENLANKIFLFYSNRRPQDSAYLSNLQELEQSNGNFVLVPTMTAFEESLESWTGRTGYIDKNMLSSVITDLKLPIYYIAGPASMVASLKAVLKEIGIEEDNIRTEEFTGY